MSGLILLSGLMSLTSTFKGAHSLAIKLQLSQIESKLELSPQYVILMMSRVCAKVDLVRVTLLNEKYEAEFS